MSACLDLMLVKVNFIGKEVNTPVHESGTYPTNMHSYFKRIKTCLTQIDAKGIIIKLYLLSDNCVCDQPTLWRARVFCTGCP